MFSLTMYRFHVSSLQGHEFIHRFLNEGMFICAFAASAYLESYPLVVNTKANDRNATATHYNFEIESSMPALLFSPGWRNSSRNYSYFRLSRDIEHPFLGCN
ncbi:hypothetical protein M405DRAFT_428066 [Rhizopogon salebrosus TDB-379]|nr:hypothetical protein M405DRAFT_428066 [Rhizopogon salebrosus TDB-379]